MNWIGAVALLLMLSRLPGALLVLDGAILNSDEIQFTFSALNRFLAVPSTRVAWPGGTLQMLSLPVFALDYVCCSAFGISQTDAPPGNP